MKQALYDLNIYQGADEVYVFSLYNVDQEDNRIPINLANCKFKLGIRRSLAEDKITDITTEDGNIKIGVVTDNVFTPTTSNPNALQITFPHILTEQLTSPNYLYDLFKIASDGSREMLIKGNIIVTKSVSYA